jgi:hypothetical protein
MAKDGDIIDFMLGGIMNFFGKILGVLATWAGKLIVLIFRGLWALLKWIVNGIKDLLTKKADAPVVSEAEQTQTVETATEAATEPATEAATEAVAEPATEAVTEPATEAAE